MSWWEDRVESEQALDECGCAPSARERRLLWPTMSRRGALGFGILGLATIGAIGGPLIPPAFAADYPSWEDVERAMANVSAKAAEVTKIQALIQGLADDVALKRGLADQAANEFY